jgi:hypothetical protein
VNCTISCVDACAAAGANGGCANGGTCNRPSFGLSTCVPALVTTDNNATASCHASFFQLTSAAAFSARSYAGLVELNSSLLLMHGSVDAGFTNSVYATTDAAEWTVLSNPVLAIAQGSQAYVTDSAAGVVYFTVDGFTVYRVNATAVDVLPAFADRAFMLLVDHSMLLLNSKLHILGGKIAQAAQIESAALTAAIAPALQAVDHSSSLCFC